MSKHRFWHARDAVHGFAYDPMILCPCNFRICYKRSKKAVHVRFGSNEVGFCSSFRVGFHLFSKLAKGFSAPSFLGIGFSKIPDAITLVSPPVMVFGNIVLPLIQGDMTLDLVYGMLGSDC